MNDIRRTILWVIFGFSMVLLWDQWQVFNGSKATFFPSSTQTAKPSATASGTASVGTAMPTASLPIGSPAAVPAGAPSTTPSTPKERLVVNTDVLSLTFDSEGGSLVHTAFKKYKDQEHKDQGFVLLDESANRVYVAQTGLIAGNGGNAFPTHKTMMALVSSDHVFKEGQNELQVKFESTDFSGIKLLKTYTIRQGAYDLGVSHDQTDQGFLRKAYQNDQDTSHAALAPACISI